jgi:hypothetical protein
MTPKWIVENDVFDEDLGPLVDEIKRQGMEVVEIKYVPFESGSYDHFKDNDCVIFYGSLNLMRQLQRQKPWVPGGWCNFQNFECTTYYAHFGKYLLNDRYIMMPLAEVKRRKDELYHPPLSSEFHPIFIRPSSGFKTFTGKVVLEKDFEKDFEWFDEFATPESIVVIADPWDIKAEYRFFVANKQVIASSSYRIDGKLNYDALVPDGARDLAIKIAAEEWEPDPLYVIDICCHEGRLGDGFYLMEINSFSCSGLYHCDIKPIVEYASKQAKSEWENTKNVC